MLDILSNPGFASVLEADALQMSLGYDRDKVISHRENTCIFCMHKVILICQLKDLFTDVCTTLLSKMVS